MYDCTLPALHLPLHFWFSREIAGVGYHQNGNDPDYHTELHSGFSETKGWCHRDYVSYSLEMGKHRKGHKNPNPCALGHIVKLLICIWIQTSTNKSYKMQKLMFKDVHAGFCFVRVLHFLKMPFLILRLFLSLLFGFLSLTHHHKSSVTAATFISHTCNNVGPCN